MDGYNNAIVKNNMAIFLPINNAKQTNTIRIIFYLGGEVGARVYSPLFIRLAEKGM